MTRLNDLTVTKITGVYTPAYPEPERFLMPERPYYGISVAIDGEIAYTHNGKTYISDRDHAVFLPKDASYELNCYKAGSFTLVNFLCDDNFNCTDFISFPISDAEMFIRIHQSMTKLYLFETPGSYAELMSLLYSMIAKLCAGSERGNVYPVIRTAIKYMEENISDPELSNSKLAEASGVSEVYFRKLFKESLGMSPRQYILQARVNKAKHMLENGNKSIEEIHIACGYSNIYYFFKVFKEKTGYTPTEYRERFYRKTF